MAWVYLPVLLALLSTQKEDWVASWMSDFPATILDDEILWNPVLWERVERHEVISLEKRRSHEVMAVSSNTIFLNKRNRLIFGETQMANQPLCWVVKRIGCIAQAHFPITLLIVFSVEVTEHNGQECPRMSGTSCMVILDYIGGFCHFQPAMIILLIEFKLEIILTSFI